MGGGKGRGEEGNGKHMEDRQAWGFWLNPIDYKRNVTIMLCYGYICI